MSEGILDVAADLAALGLNPLDFLRTKSQVERDILAAIRDRVMTIRKQEHAYLAHEIAKALEGRI